MSSGEWSFIGPQASEEMYDYPVGFPRLIESPAALIDWAGHLSEKSWFDARKLFACLDRVRTDNNLFEAG